MPEDAVPRLSGSRSDRSSATAGTTPRCGLDRQVSTYVRSSVVGDVFKALADPTRRAVLDELTDRNGQTLFELCARLTTRHGVGSTRQAISQHLDLLEQAGLVTTSRDGRYKFHFIDTSPLRAVTDRWPVQD
ncbi:MAG: metalloregulator ArsR/SmtB family transcription factor [Actinobacteria bacterium]|nr:metalloregulator ArsR/SmtB family transcription factor [Actinomycetota bacterium]